MVNIYKISLRNINIAKLYMRGLHRHKDSRQGFKTGVSAKHLNCSKVKWSEVKCRKVKRPISVSVFVKTLVSNFLPWIQVKRRPGPLTMAKRRQAGENWDLVLRIYKWLEFIIIIIFFFCLFSCYPLKHPQGRSRERIFPFKVPPLQFNGINGLFRGFNIYLIILLRLVYRISFLFVFIWCLGCVPEMFQSGESYVSGLLTLDDVHWDIIGLSS